MMVIGVAALTLVLTGCDVKSTGSCEREGSKHTNKDGVSFTCKRLPEDGMPGAGKLVWIRD